MSVRETSIGSTSGLVPSRHSWSGAAVVVDADRVTPVDLEILSAARTFKDRGRGTAAALGQASGPAHPL